MKTDSLNALLIDRELGELAPETTDLLEAWLEEHPESAPLTGAVRRSLGVTRDAVRKYPELARPEAPLLEPRVTTSSVRRSRLVPLALAASILLLLGGGAWVGFLAGRDPALRTASVGQRASNATPAASAATTRNNPWAHYVLAPDPRGGLTIVRHNPKS